MKSLDLFREDAWLSCWHER